MFFIFKIKKCIKKKEAFIIALLGPVFSVIVAIVDANMAGVLPRYYADFTWGFMISAFMLFLHEQLQLLFKVSRPWLVNVEESELISLLL